MLNRGTKLKNSIIVFASILLISFALITVNFKSSKSPIILESLFVWIVSPIQTLFTHTANSISDTIDHYFFLVNISKENENLRREIAGLIKQKNSLQEQVYQKERLLGLGRYQDNRSGQSEVASIIGRDATQWSKVVFIDKGTKQGVREDFAVVTDLGVIGHVIQSNSNSSKVLLINDSRSAVDALFQKSRVSGVVVGTGEDVCRMRYVPIGAVVNVGDKVVASGMGGIFTKGLMVGTVSRVTKRKQGLFQEITIAPSADLTRLEEVLVLLP